jgi:hypothetical protein
MRGEKMKQETKKRLGRILTTCLAVLTMAGMMPGSMLGVKESFAETKNFTDLTGHWSAEIVKEAASRGIVNGYQQYDGTYLYKPENLMNRQEFFTLVVNVLSAQPDTTGVDVSKFCDVVPSEWYATTVAKAVAAGITDGTTTVEKDGYASFGVNLMITRQEAAKIVSSIIDPSKELTYDEMVAGQQKYEGIKDKSKIASWAASHVEKVFVRGYMQGDDTNSFNPTNALTRAEAATLLLNVVKKETRILGPKQSASDITTGSAITTQPAVTSGAVTDTTSATKMDLDAILKTTEVALRSVSVSGSNKGCTGEHDKDKGAFTEGRGTRSDPYVISTEAQLNHIREHIGDGSYFILANDIRIDTDFAPAGSGDEKIEPFKNGNWCPIGTKKKPFDGIFDGNGHAIIGLDVQTTNQYSGLFGYINKDAGIENLMMKSCTVNGGQYTGGIVGYNEGSVTNCLIEKKTDVSGSSYVGGIVGYTVTNISGCQNEGTVKGSQFATGGIAGYIMIEGTITGCINDGDVSGSQAVGGIVGNLLGFGKGTNVKQCLNRGSVSSKGYNAGGIVGATDGGSSGVTVENCANNGNLTGSGVNGGIVGSLDSKSEVSYCYNISEVYGNGAGGIVGTNSGKVIYSINQGTVKGKSYAGGLIAAQVDDALLTQSYNEGYVYSDYRAGGLVGESQAKIRNCYNSGKVESNSYAGGLVGLNRSGVYYCYSVGKVTGDMVGQLAGSNKSSFNYCFFSKTNGDTAVYENEGSAKLEKSYGLTEAQLQGSEDISFSALSKYKLITLLNEEYGKTVWETQKGWAYPGIVGLPRI